MEFFPLLVKISRTRKQIKIVHVEINAAALRTDLQGNRTNGAIIEQLVLPQIASYSKALSINIIRQPWKQWNLCRKVADPSIIRSVRRFIYPVAKEIHHHWTKSLNNIYQKSIPLFRSNRKRKRRNGRKNIYKTWKEPKRKSISGTFHGYFCWSIAASQQFRECGETHSRCQLFGLKAGASSTLNYFDRATSG